MYSSLALLAATALPFASARTVHSVLVFSRHGDRTAKWYKGYEMTNLGANQNYDSGAFYRQRYLANGADDQIAGISSDVARASQLYASAPDQHVLFQTATNFLQGLYPPLEDIDEALATEELVNGTDVSDPLNGHQFILIHGEDKKSPDTIWIKGDESCPAYETATTAYEDSEEYQQTMEDTSSFYSRFEPLLADIMGAENVTYEYAYDVFDLLNVASVHNSSVAPEIESSDLDQLRYLANQWEWGHNYNASDADRSIGGMSLAGGILEQLDDVVSGSAAVKFSLLAGSYDTFMSFFGLTDLQSVSDNFTGLPHYAATMAFELFTDGDDETFPENADQDLRVRFLFRNGTDTTEDLNSYPLFGEDADDYSYGEFKDRLGGLAISNVAEWCSVCNADTYFCAAETAQAQASGDANEAESSSSGLSNAAAGGIGAGVTAAVLLAAGALVAVFMRRRSKKQAAVAVQREEKLRGDSSSENV
ncbi:hypothetical protein Q7P37_000556 [Cladosporium fusiforme]